MGTGYTGNLRALVAGDTRCSPGRVGDQFLNSGHFTLTGYAIGTFPSNIASRGSCTGAGNINWDNQLAKNWYIKEKYRIKFSMDFFNFLNHPNFNTGNLEGSSYNSTAPVLCGNQQTPCSPTNNVITSYSAPNITSNGFGVAGSVNPGRTLQYALKFSF